MKIWKLTPLDQNQYDWEASEYTGEVIVRAESEERARKFVSDRFWRAAGKPTSADLVIVPLWERQDVVSVVEVKDGGYSKAGSEEILDPEEARAYNDV